MTDPIDLKQTILEQLLCLEGDKPGLSEQEKQDLLKQIGELPEGDLAILLESIPHALRAMVWRSIPEEKSADIFYDLAEDTAENLLRSLDRAQAVKLVQSLDDVYLIRLSDMLPDDLLDVALANLSSKEKRRVIDALNFSEAQVGRYVEGMNIVTNEQSSIGLLKKKIAKYTTMPPGRGFFVVSKEDGRYRGMIPYSYLGSLDDKDKVGEHLVEIPPLQAADELDDARDIFAEVELYIMPVVNAGGIYQGVLTYRTLMDTIEELSDIQRLREQGVDEEDLFTPVKIATRRRAIWLGINLLTALLASWVIGIFEVTLSEVVALAVLMPIVASMGGIAGSQTLTVTIRGLSMGTLTETNLKPLLKKEFHVALLNGLIWSALIAVIVNYWFDDWALSFIIFIAVTVNVLAAAASGTIIPFVLHKCKIDPAISGSVILTTVTDVIGFFCFLGLGSVFLLAS
jgi:magnesium transporter